ncbi:hypothetical protein GOV05_02810 [Candidatus Woesearchaeota archaeon]|nr:hypothetical protein [Candidatus Woesearchaeota archaeon]
MSDESFKRRSEFLLYYKRKDIRNSIVESSKDLEVVPNFDNNFFSKRPDILSYPDEIIDAVKKGATSFHASEERWSNPMDLSPTLKKGELDALRIGWDLVLDIDIPCWELSKLIAKLIINALRDNGVKKSVGIKFSGNKGFHIGVPFESFPETINGVPTKMLFPDTTRRVGAYLINYIKEKYKFVDDKLVFDDRTYTLNELIELTGLKREEIVEVVCPDCHKPRNEKRTIPKHVFICSNCQKNFEVVGEEKYVTCDKCKSLVTQKELVSKKRKEGCLGCNSKKNPENRFALIEIDTVLISSRHLYRTVYSLHEKTGLVSAPFNPDKVDKFKKSFCTPSNFKIGKYKFLDRENAVVGEATPLFIKAYDYNYVEEKQEEKKGGAMRFEEVERLEHEIPFELFPPCIRLGLNGLEDGKKRFVFTLINFLSSTGYDYDRIEEILVEWNKKNPEALREVNLLGQIRYAKQQQKRVLPPNCDNKMYYLDFGICKPDNLCEKIKNPAQYAKRKAKHRKEPKKTKVKDEKPRV